MKRLFIALICLTYSLVSNAQVNIGLGAGTEWLRLEAGYSFTENIHGGVQIAPGYRLASIPAFYGGFMRYTFDENPLFGGSSSFRGYVGGSLGLISAGNVYDYIGYDYDSQIALGISGNGGLEILFGRQGKIGYYYELNIGQVPNFLNSALRSWENLYSDNDSRINPAAWWGMSTGFRVYFMN